MKNGSYHSYDCPNLNLNSEPTHSQYYIADQSAEFKYDAMRIQTKILSNDNPVVVALYDEQKNQYYKPRYDDINDEIALGEEIDGTDIYNYEFEYESSDGTITRVPINDLSLLPNAKADLYNDKYIYDHKNLACYTCCISRNYNPVVKYYKGELRRTYVTKNKELLIEMTPGKLDFVYYSTGSSYNGGESITTANMIDLNELRNRQNAVYTYLAHIRNNLYKHNDYINR